MIVTESRPARAFATPESEYFAGIKVMETLDATTHDGSYAGMSQLLDLTEDHGNEQAEYQTKIIQTPSDDDDSSISDYDERDFYEFIAVDYRSTPSSSPEKHIPTLSNRNVVDLDEGICDAVNNETSDDIDDYSSLKNPRSGTPQDVGQTEDVSETVNNGTQKNLDDCGSIPSAERPVLAQERGRRQNGEICETMNDEIQNPTTSANNADDNVVQVKKKKLRRVRCSKLESRRPSATKSVDSKCDDIETQESENEETTAGPINVGDSIVSEADFEVTLSQNSSVFRNSAIYGFKEPAKRQFSETDCDESDTSGSGSKKSRSSDILQIDQKQELKCKECFEVFSDKYRLFRHSIIHKTDNHFRCDECQESFAYPVMLHNHKLNRHSPEKKYICNVCNKVYKRESYLELHMNLHRKQKFACSACGQDFLSIRMLMNHAVNKHPDSRNAGENVGLKPVEKCDTNAEMANTLCVKDKAMSDKTNTCKMDSKMDRKADDMYKSDTSTSDAIRMVQKKDKSGKAAIPKIEFGKKKINAPQQIKPKSKVTEYKCKHCDVVHKSKQQLNKHMLKEHNESPFECNECNLKFAALTNLKQHNKDRHSNESAVCPICLKVFKCKRYLKEHIRFTHEKRKYFVCKICGMRYSKSKPLKIHELRHHHNGELSQGIDSEPKHRQDETIHKLKNEPDGEPKHKHDGDQKVEMIEEIIRPETNPEKFQDINNEPHYDYEDANAAMNKP